GDDVVVCVVTEIREERKLRHFEPVGCYCGHQSIVTGCARGLRIDIQYRNHVGKRCRRRTTFIPRDVQGAIRIRIAQGWQEMQAAARMLIESYRCMLDRGQVSKSKTLEQDIAEWVYTRIVPDNAH